MNETPRGLRAYIAILGRRNAGKSTFLNALSGQKVSIVSSQPGTTTDPVEKNMELAPVGPVVLVDTAGMDDTGSLGEMRVARSMDIVKRSDVCVIVCARDEWTGCENDIARILDEKKIPYIILRNQNDALGKTPVIKADIWGNEHSIGQNIPIIDADITHHIDKSELAWLLQQILHGDKQSPSALANDLLPAGGLAILVVPLDSGAPKGRLILPQVQTVRDILDGNKISLITTEKQYSKVFGKLASPPDLVICDSQVVDLVAAQTPPGVPLTTFSILMARLKGDLKEMALGARALKTLRPGDSVLVQEACSHHPQEDDIGRTKIPRLLQKVAGGKLDIEWSAGKELVNYNKDFKVIVHCGACVITNTQMLARISEAARENIPITNYGMAISFARGILERVLSPFPEALRAFRGE